MLSRGAPANSHVGSLPERSRDRSMPAVQPYSFLTSALVSVFGGAPPRRQGPLLFPKVKGQSHFALGIATAGGLQLRRPCPLLSL